MKQERRLITFRMLKKVCAFAGYECIHGDHPKATKWDCGKCCAKLCPVFNRLKKEKEPRFAVLDEVTP